MTPQPRDLTMPYDVIPEQCIGCERMQYWTRSVREIQARRSKVLEQAAQVMGQMEIAEEGVDSESQEL